MKLIKRTASNIVLLGAMLLLPCLQAQAEAQLMLNGKTLDTREVKDADVRLSVLEWSDADKSKNLIGQYLQNPAGFAQILAKEETRGYLFTAESLGYSVKYAWQAEEPGGKRVVVAVVPALKTWNPYLWKQANTADSGYSLIELHYQGEEAIANTSIDSKIVQDVQGRLELLDTSDSKVFARLKDGTPYYLKKS